MIQKHGYSWSLSVLKDNRNEFQKFKIRVILVLYAYNIFKKLKRHIGSCSLPPQYLDIHIFFEKNTWLPRTVFSTG